MNSSELVSIIIPTYKRSTFLARAIDSVLNQTYKNIEIIVVDDNKSNCIYRKNTELVMEKYRNNLNVIYVKNKYNMGGSLARNEGIKIANGEFIAFLDDDDVYLENKIRNQLNYMKKNKVQMCFTDIKILDENDRIINLKSHPYIKKNTKNDLLAYHLMYHLTPTDTYMFKKDVLIEFGGFEKARVGQEFILMLKMIENEVSIGYLPEVTAIQYTHGQERISCGDNKIKGEDELYAFKKLYFNKLNQKQKRYIKFRHYAVKSRAHIEQHDYLKFIENAFKSFLYSPLSTVREGLSLIKREK